jgi:hypothetical protein
MPSNVSIISASWADVDSQVMSISGSNDTGRGGTLGFTYNGQNSWFPNPTDSTFTTSWITPRFTLQNAGYIFASDTVHSISTSTTVPNNTLPYGSNNPDRNAIISNTDFDTQWRLRVIVRPGNTNATDSLIYLTVYGLNENGYAFHSDYSIGNMIFQTYAPQTSNNFESVTSNNDLGTPEDITNFASQFTAYQLPIELPDSTSKYVQAIGYFQFNGSTNIKYIGLRIDIEHPNTSNRFHKIELIPINRSVGAAPIANRILQPHSVDHPYSKCGWGVDTYLAISVPPIGEMVELVNIKDSTVNKNPGNQSAFSSYEYNAEVGEDHWPWSISRVAGTTPSSATGATKGVPPMVNMTNNSEPGGNGTNSETVTVSSEVIHLQYSNANLKYNNYGWKRLEEPYETNVQYSQRYLNTETSGMSDTAGASGPHNIPFIFHTQTIYLKESTGHETLSFYYHARGSNIGTLQVLAWDSRGAFRHPDYNQEYNNFLPPAATLLSIRFWDGTDIQGTGGATTQIGPGQIHTTGTQPWYRAEVELSNLPKKNDSGEEIPYKFVFHYRKNGTSYNGDFCVNNIRITGLNEPGVVSPGPGGDDDSPI